MRSGWLLLFFCGCRGGTALSDAQGVWLRVEGDAGVQLVLGGPRCPALSAGATVTLNGAAGAVLERGGRAGGCGGGCRDAVVRWPGAAPQMDFVVEDAARRLRVVVAAAAPRLAFPSTEADGGLPHLSRGAEVPLRWEPQVPWEHLRVDLRNPALPWRGGRPIALCSPGKCLPHARDAGVLLARLPASVMPGPTGLTATALFPPRVERCEGASSCTAQLPPAAATATGAVLVDP